MKLKYQMWLLFSLLFIVMGVALYYFIVQAYEERVIEGHKTITINQGATIVERLQGVYPKFPERTAGYLSTYSNRLDVRLLLIDLQGQVRYDSYGQLEAGTKISIPVLKEENSLPRTTFQITSNYGYVQHTLLPLEGTQPVGTYLLMIEDVNILYEDIQSFQRWTLLVIGTAVIIFFILSFGIASLFSRPISQMISEMNKISHHNRSFTFKYNRKDEINDLSVAIEGMVQQLNQYEKRQRQFLSASSHELKTPLATMQLISENLALVRENPEDHEEFVADLMVQIDKMKQMVNQLLDMNRAWDRSLRKEPLEASEIKKHLQKNFQHACENKRIKLDFTLEDVMLHVDHASFFQAIDNIISNAVRYSPSNTMISVTVTKSEKDNVELSIDDEGIGISEEDLPYVFDPFYRTRDASEWSQEGSGLGLALVKQIIEQHGGTITVQSTKGKGTCFLITLCNKNVT
ncbi:sensor histidine kinase [Alkalihalobacterium chitinilyticum]|uniref:histidine kinase n=1 Tax=Alkalihalobacterium chitinilyticum TaxID=2980103 RepID=A0ABT5VHT6_9BACI|nr:HAMP domain-containing sensor histidine kinase [Alkalihalobacterium chitinilyticum]MDE5414312.1 HAMP domain-containing histidine kinase [Alkalihalobacterium chitinilyticum]